MRERERESEKNTNNIKSRIMCIVKKSASTALFFHHLTHINKYIYIYIYIDELNMQFFFFNKYYFY